MGAAAGKRLAAHEHRSRAGTRKRPRRPRAQPRRPRGRPAALPRRPARRPARCPRAPATALLPAAEAEPLRRRAAEIHTRINPPAPPAIRAELRPYQLDGFQFLAYLAANRFGGILADDMGLGKTLQTLAWLAWLRDRGETRPALVVCPKSVQNGWRAEAARFFPSLPVALWDRRETGSGLDGTAGLVVINYAQMRIRASDLQDVDWSAVVLDEAQAIKNPDSQNARAACDLKAAHKLALTGTPIENKLLDLWSIMEFAMPGVLGNRTEFGRRFNPERDPGATASLAGALRPFLLRRTKTQVASELPERVEEDLLCPLEGVQSQLYEAELKRVQAIRLALKTRADLDRTRFHVLTALLRLRQICCHPCLVSPDLRAAPSAKIEALVDLLEPLMAEGNKVLVFSQFTSVLDLLQEELNPYEWPLFLLTGQTENRGELVERFQACDGPAVFLLSLKAAGAGLNLTAASYVVLFDPWWNPAVEAQAIDRTHRIGQTQRVNAYRLVAAGSVEEKIRVTTLDIVVTITYMVLIVGAGCWVGIRHRRKSATGEARQYFLAGSTLTLADDRHGALRHQHFLRAPRQPRPGRIRGGAPARELRVDGRFDADPARDGFRPVLHPLAKSPRCRTSWKNATAAPAVTSWRGFRSFRRFSSTSDSRCSPDPSCSAGCSASIHGSASSSSPWPPPLYVVVGGLMAVVFTETVETVVLLFGAALITYFSFKFLGGDQGVGPAGASLSRHSRRLRKNP
jgi:hypothetical protein